MLQGLASRVKVLHDFVEAYVSRVFSGLIRKISNLLGRCAVQLCYICALPISDYYPIF